MTERLDLSPLGPDEATPLARHEGLDALRGLAIVWMVAFHFCFDLNHFGLLQPPQQFLTDPFWTVQRVCIVSLFMFCAGAGQALAVAQGLTWRRFGRRWMQIAACAALVSLATWWTFPRSWVFFGVLHGLAVMVLVARLSAGWSRPWLVGLGAVALALPQLTGHPLFDVPALQWLGLGTFKPVTEDYAPVLPWMGMVWWGLALGPVLFGGGRSGASRRARPVMRPLQALRPLVWLGRWPLTVYMLHQPLLWGAILAFRATIGA